MSDILRVVDLSQVYGSTRVLDKVSFSLGQGERLAVLGRSGSGKTTLLRLIAGLEPPSNGEIHLEGRAGSRAGRVLLAPERRGVAMVFQGLALFPHLRALDQIAFAAKGRGGVALARSLLERVGLGDRDQARIEELSGGERQRIALARALAQGPRLILMDEPFASLDDERRTTMRDLLRDLLDTSDVSLLLVTHAREDALDLAERAIVLDGGRAVADDRLESLLDQPRHAAVVRAFGLGILVEGVCASPGHVTSKFGVLDVPQRVPPGPGWFLVRPDQPRIVGDGSGVPGVVRSVEFRPGEGREVRRIAVVEVEGARLKVFSRDTAVVVRDAVRVRIDGVCDPVKA